MRKNIEKYHPKYTKLSSKRGAPRVSTNRSSLTFAVSGESWPQNPLQRASKSNLDRFVMDLLEVVGRFGSPNYEKRQAASNSKQTDISSYFST